MEQDWLEEGLTALRPLQQLQQLSLGLDGWQGVASVRGMWETLGQLTNRKDLQVREGGGRFAKVELKARIAGLFAAGVQTAVLAARRFGISCFACCQHWSKASSLRNLNGRHSSKRRPAGALEFMLLRLLGATAKSTNA